jgi:hypothetical protein
MRTILPARVGLIDESEIGLVDECSGLQSVTFALLLTEWADSRSDSRMNM